MAVNTATYICRSILIVIDLAQSFFVGINQILRRVELSIDTINGLWSRWSDYTYIKP